MSALVSGLADLQQAVQESGQVRRTDSGLVIPRYNTPVSLIGQAVAPAYGSANQVELIKYQAKANFYVIFCGVLFGWIGAGAPPLPGDLSFSVDIDRPLGSTTAGYAVRDFGAVTVPVGLITNGAISYHRPVEFRLSGSETIRVKGFTVANVGVGGRNFLVASLVGFEWPAEGSEGY